MVSLPHEVNMESKLTHFTCTTHSWSYCTRLDGAAYSKEMLILSW